MHAHASLHFCPRFCHYLRADSHKRRHMGEGGAGHSVLASPFLPHPPSSLYPRPLHSHRTTRHHPSSQNRSMLHKKVMPSVSHTWCPHQYPYRYQHVVLIAVPIPVPTRGALKPIRCDHWAWHCQGPLSPQTPWVTSQQKIHRGVILRSPDDDDCAATW